MLADPDGKLALELGVYGTPETYLFAADGTLLSRHTGELTREVWQRQFVPKLNEARAAPLASPAPARQESKP
ncbi:Thiol:disulfide interchange protein DsbE [compost metagenome]